MADILPPFELVVLCPPPLVVVGLELPPLELVGVKLPPLEVVGLKLPPFSVVVTPLPPPAIAFEYALKFLSWHENIISFTCTTLFGIVNTISAGLATSALSTKESVNMDSAP